MIRPEIVAEVSGNHVQSLRIAEGLVVNAARAGADAVKFQCWSPGKMVMGPSTPLTEGLWAGQTPAELYEASHLPWNWYRGLFDLAIDHGVQPFASVFDHHALEFLERLGCQRYKIASCELVDLPLIRAVASTGKAMVISTGMGTKEEIHQAWEAALLGGCGDLTLLHCVSAYPTEAEGVNLRTMLDMGALYAGRALIGFSDHTTGIAAAVTAAAMGASMIEKHITSSSNAPDAAFSLYADEFGKLVRECKAAAKMLGGVTYGPQPGDSSALRRGVYFACAFPPGHVIEEKDIVTARPATAVMPRDIARLIGGTVNQTVHMGQPVELEHIDAFNFDLQAV